MLVVQWAVLSGRGSRVVRRGRGVGFREGYGREGERFVASGAVGMEDGVPEVGGMRSGVVRGVDYGNRAVKLVSFVLM